MINLIAITAVYIKYCNARLPDTIHINKSETVSLCYDVPVSATIDHQTIRLNQPIVFKQCHMGQYEMKTNLFGAIPLKKIKVKVVDDQKITPSGEVIGVYVETDGLFVLDTDQFTGENSMEYAPSKNKLYRGDYIKKIDGKDIVSKKQFNKTTNCDVIIGTPFTHLASVAAAIDTNKIGVAAENCADKEKGAFTGEVSAAMVASTGAKYVILGHSERRAYYHETPEILKTKVELALANGLTPIFCIGEVLEEREAGKHLEVVDAQIEGSLFALSAEDFGKIILAYEPVWAIGTGKTATADQAEEIHAHIRATLAAKYGNEIADNCTILYGGSSNGGNAKELFAKPNVDGGLIGGASLSVEKFMPIIEAFDK